MNGPGFVLMLLFAVVSADCGQDSGRRTGIRPNPGGSAMTKNIRWLGHAGFVVRGSRTVCVDPYRVSAGEPAGLILVTHEHSDHCSPEDAAKFIGPDTWIVAPAAAAAKLTGVAGKTDRVITVRPGETLNLDGVEVRIVPAYNLKIPNHSPDKGHVGYVFRLDGVTYYHAGDTDRIPEMKTLTGVDVAFLPVGGTYTMDAKQAAEAAAEITPRLAVPMHWGGVVGSEKDALEFKKHCKSEVWIPTLSK
jgi:L-ascorbate metabolism protein UlaG (beta-lactamase superfamily)